MEGNSNCGAQVMGPFSLVSHEWEDYKAEAPENVVSNCSDKMSIGFPTFTSLKDHTDLSVML